MKRYTVTHNNTTYPAARITLGGQNFTISTIRELRDMGLNPDQPPHATIVVPESILVTCEGGDIFALAIERGIIPADTPNPYGAPDSATAEILEGFNEFTRYNAPHPTPAAPVVPAGCILIKLPGLSDCEISIQAEPETTDPAAHFDDKETANTVRRRATAI